MRILFLTAALLFGTLQAKLIDLDIDLSAGVRHDKLSAEIKTYNPPPANSTLTKGSLISTDDFKTSEITLYQIGLKSRWRPCNWIAYFEGSYAFSNNGRFCEEIIPAPGVLGRRSRVQATFHDGRARDLTLGAGYLFPICRWVSIGPLFGWSYHYQRFHTKNPLLNHTPSPVTHVRYINRWQGPWAGLDLALSLLCFDFHAGYAYTWGDWYATWLLTAVNTERRAYADRPRAPGHTLYIDGQFNIWPCFNIAVGLKYYHYRIHHGVPNPKAITTTTINPLDLLEARVPHAKWEAIVATFDIGFSF